MLIYSPPVEHFFIAIFHLRRVQGLGGLSFPRPFLPSGQPRAGPARRPEAGPVLRIQDVGDDLSVSHGLRRPRRRSVKEAAGVPGAIGTQAVDLQGEASTEFLVSGCIFPN